MSVLFRAAGLRKQFAEGPVVLRDVSLNAQPWAPLVIFGDSGCGKTTLLRCLAGTFRLDAGSVHLDDGHGHHRIDDVDPRTRAWLRREHVGVVDGELIAPPCDATRDVLVQAMAGQAAGGVQPSADAWERADELLARVGLDDAADRPVGLLGQQARRTLAIARMLVRPAAVLLLDDPLRGVLPNAVAPLGALIADAATSSALVLTTTTPPPALFDHAYDTMSLTDGVLR